MPCTPTSSRSESPDTSHLFALLQLPAELLSLVVAFVEPSDPHSLSETCRTFYAVSRREYIQYRFTVEGQERKGYRKAFGREPDDPLLWMYCVEGAQSGELGPGESSVEVWIGQGVVTPSETFFDDSASKPEELDWDEAKEALVHATPELVRGRFLCPECDGTRQVWAGCWEVAKRWPMLEAAKRLEAVSCPRCMVSEEQVAEEQERAMGYESEEEAREARRSPSWDFTREPEDWD